MRVAGGLVVIVTLAACLEAQLVPCGDQLCPQGTVCVGGSVCASPEQVDACSGVADGEACTFGASTGVCQGAVCVPTGCGNGKLEGDEACDDGNNVGGDGCSADCGKIEICGDGILDEGEPCDDGNTNTVDGCDACAQSRWVASAKLGGNTTATSIGLSYPSGIAIDRAGAYYVAELGAYRVRRVDQNGIVTTVAGLGTPGFSGDGGPATRAQLGYIDEVVVDDLGNLYVADTDAHRVRRVSPSGLITTIAGNGSGAFSGDGGPATAAGVPAPRSIAVDGSGNLYIAADARVRRVDPNGIITTIAGTGATGFTGDGGPATAAMLGSVYDVAVFGSDLYIADRSYGRIRKVSSDGTITTTAGGGASNAEGVAATTAVLGTLSYLSFDRGGNLYVTG